METNGHKVSPRPILEAVGDEETSRVRIGTARRLLPIVHGAVLVNGTPLAQQRERVPGAVPSDQDVAFTANSPVPA